MQNPVAEFRSIGKRYGPHWAVREIDWALPEGEIIGLVGHNGAGKSTLFRLLLGLLQADAGQLRLFGKDVSELSLCEARSQIGWLPENLALFDNLSAEETLVFFARLKKVQTPNIPQLLASVGLPNARHQRVATFSKGMRQRLGLAQALLGQPKLLLMDEPTNGLDPEGVRDFYNRLEQERARGCTVLVSSHILADLEQRIRHIAILRSGLLVAAGTLADVRAGTPLPVCIEIDFALPADRLSEATSTALSQLGARSEIRREGLRIHIAREQKLAALALLSQDPAPTRDLRIQEASLEQLVFGAAA